MATVMPSPQFQGLDDTGVALAGGLLYTYAAGGSTPLATYSDSTLVTPNTNPVVLSAAGRATVYLSAAAYKFVLKTSAGVTVYTQDNVLPSGSGTDLTSLTATVTALSAAAATKTGAETLTNKTLTSPIVNTPTGTVKTEVVTATNVITAAESGTTFFLNHTTEFVSTLPAMAAGLRYTFIVTGAPSGASYTVVAASGTPIKGHVVCSQDAGGTADSETSGVLTVTFVDSKAVAGDRAVFDCDGTNWFVTATCKVFDAITFS